MLALAPHIILPMEFVLPQGEASRPAWLLRAGMFLYDHLGGCKRLPPSRALRLDRHPIGEGLRPGITRALVYSDCLVDDSRLVCLTALDAAERGDTILTRTRLVAAERDATGWCATVESRRGRVELHAKVLVNAAGPWVDEVLDTLHGAHRTSAVRLVKGSHIVVPRLYAGEHAFLMQNPDRRVVFAIPYEERFTLVGTTDVPWTGRPARARISDAEIDYLCATLTRYFKQPAARQAVMWSFAGIRPLVDDHAGSASAGTRDYTLELDTADGGAAILSIFGGKITPHRKLAEHALEKLSPFFHALGPAWTAAAPLPRGATFRAATSPLSSPSSPPSGRNFRGRFCTSWSERTARARQFCWAMLAGPRSWGETAADIFIRRKSST